MKRYGGQYLLQGCQGHTDGTCSHSKVPVLLDRWNAIVQSKLLFQLRVIDQSSDFVEEPFALSLGTRQSASAEKVQGGPRTRVEACSKVVTDHLEASNYCIGWWDTI